MADSLIDMKSMAKALGQYSKLNDLINSGCESIDKFYKTQENIKKTLIAQGVLESDAMKILTFKQTISGHIQDNLTKNLEKQTTFQSSLIRMNEVLLQAEKEKVDLSYKLLRIDTIINKKKNDLMLLLKSQKKMTDPEVVLLLKQAKILNEIKSTFEVNLRAQNKLTDEANKQINVGKDTLSILKSEGAEINTQQKVYQAISYILKQSLEYFKQIDNAQFTLRKNLGLFRGDFSQLEDQSKDLGYELAKYGVSFEDVVKSQTAISDAWTSQVASSKEVVKQVSLIAQTFGITADESVSFFKTLTQISGTSLKDTSEYAFGVAQSIAKASGIPLPKIMNDVAKASSVVKTMTGGSVVNLIKAAATAQRMGTTIDNMAKSSRFMLDFEQSVNAEMEASVMVGKNINFVRARQLAFDKDIVGSNEEILDQVKRIGDFNKLNPLQMESVAKAAGKTVDELQSMLQMDSEMAELDQDKVKEYKSLMEKTEKQLKLEGKLNNAKLQSLTNQTRINSLTSVWNSLLMKVTEPITNLIGKGLERIIGFVEWLDKIFEENKVLVSVTSIAIAIGGLVGGFFALKKATGFLGDLAGKYIGKGLGTGLESIGKGLKAIGSPQSLAGAFTLILLGGSLIAFAYGAKMLADVNWNEASLGIATFLVSMIGLTIVGSLIGALSEILIPGAAVMIAFGAALYIFGAAANETVPAIKAFGDVMEKAFKGEMEEIPIIASAVDKVISSITDNFIKFSQVEFFKTAAGIGAVSTALASFGGGSVIAGIGAGLGNLFGGDLTSKLEKIANLSDKLKSSAESIRTITESTSGKQMTQNAEAAPQTTLQENHNDIISSLKEIVDAIGNLRSDLKSGAIGINIDGRKMSQQLAYVSREA